MTICENCHGLFFQKGLAGTNHTLYRDPEMICDICQEHRTCGECDCGIYLLNFMQVIRAMLSHILSLEARLQGEKKPTTPELWRPGGLN